MEKSGLNILKKLRLGVLRFYANFWNSSEFVIEFD